VLARSFVSPPLASALLTHAFSGRVSYFTSKSHTLYELNMESIRNRDKSFQCGPSSRISAMYLDPKRRTKQATRDQTGDGKMWLDYGLTKARQITKITDNRIN
jgi:hypothetical protein